MKTKTFLFSALLGALLLAGATPSSAAPAVALIGQVGDPAPGNRVHVMLMLKSIDGGKVGKSYAFYHKQGGANAFGSYSLIGIAKPTTDVLGIAAILNQAEAAGYDLDKLAAVLPGTESLEERLSTVLLAASKDGMAEERRELLAATQFPAAMAMGRAFIATVSSTTASTFEVRRHNTITSSDGNVEGRVTTGTSPDILPAPDNLTELSGDAPRDHFRASMIWTQPQALRRKMLHWQGFNVICAERQTWRDQFGQDPPANITRAALLNAMAGGFAVQVNELPVLPGDDVGAPIPADSEPYFTHDFPQGEEPEDGTQFMYWVWASDYFCRPGHPSEGILITFCDRKPPSVPSKLRASRAHTYKIDGTGGSYIQLKWQGAPVEEVARYYVYAARKHDTGMEEMISHEFDPMTPHHIATVENTGDGVIEFPSNNDPLAALKIPEGQTWHFWLRCEDNAICKKNGFSNLSGVTGAVPAFLPIIRIAGKPAGRLVTTCCSIGGFVTTEEEHKNNDEIVTMRATRTGNYFRSVEFAAFLGNTDQYISFGLHEFKAGSNQIEIEANLVDAGAVRMAARYRTQTGRLGSWIKGQEFAQPPGRDIHIFGHASDCVTQASTGRLTCPADSVNPGDGSILPVCLEFTGTPDARTWHAYKRNGLSGRLSKFASGDFADGIDAVAKDFNSPPRGGLTCYFLQFFDDDGNASVMAPVGCVEKAPKVPLPRASISKCERVGESDQDATAFCPREGVERLEWKICPAPAGATNTETEAFLDNGVLKFATCAFIDSPRLDSDYGSDASQFIQRFNLFKGTPYRVRVRAVGKGAIDEREFGLWSEEHVITWEIEQPLNGPKVPWPAREVPGVAQQQGRAVFDTVNNLICVKIGTIPNAAGNVVPADSTPAVIPGTSIEEYLPDLRAFVIYLRPEGPKASGKELQVTHYVDKFLTAEAGADSTTVIDKSLAIKRDPNELGINGNPPPYHIWYIVHQPVIQGRTYSCSIVRHGEDREPTETVRTNVVTIPTP